MRRILASGALGQVTHVLAEAYGPVVLRPKRQTWRTRKSEGGGCLYDYAAHPLNLLNWVFGAPERVSGSILNSIYSKDIDDEVFSTLQFAGGVTAQLSVNWSDESHRKMTTRISMIGTGGRLFADRQECQLYLRAPSAAVENDFRSAAMTDRSIAQIQRDASGLPPEAMVATARPATTLPGAPKKRGWFTRARA